MDDRRAVLKETLDALKAAVHVSQYKSFIKVVHFAVCKLLDSNGAEHVRCINKHEPNFAIAAVESELACTLMYLMGFEETDGNSMVLFDYQSHQPALLAFCEIVGDELIVSKGDPAASLPIGDTTDGAILTAYFAYHMYLRVELLTLHTVPHMLQTIGPDIRSSMACVERAVARLGILKKGSEARVLWSTMRQKIIKYVEAGNRHTDRLEIGGDFNDLGRLIVAELSKKVSWRLTQVWYHIQNLQAVIGATLLGDPIPPEAANTYLRTSDNMGHDCMSEEYHAVLDSVREVMLYAVTRSLTDEEIAFVHEKSVWQSEHFLRHFQSEAFSPGVQSPWQALKRLDSGLGIEAAELLQAIRDSETMQKQQDAGEAGGRAGNTVEDRPDKRLCDVSHNRSHDEIVYIPPERSANGEATAQEVSVSTLSDPVISQKQVNEDIERSPSLDPDNPDLSSQIADFSTQKLESMNNLRKLGDLFRLISSEPEAQSLQHQLNVCVIHQKKTLKTLQQEKHELSLVLDATNEDVVRFSLQSEIEEKDEDILWAESHLKRLLRLKKETEERMQALHCHRLQHFSSGVLVLLLKQMLSYMRCDVSLLHGVAVVSLDLLDDVDVMELSRALQLPSNGENVRDSIRQRLQRWM